MSLLPPHATHPCSLRAALNSTQGAGDPFFMQQLGLTPASADPRAASGAATARGKRGKRGSSALRRDSESGVLSER
jgi:hypothetical protein